MAARLQPAKYDRVNCAATCTIGPARLGDELALRVHEWYEAGYNDDRIIAEVAEFGVKVTRGSLSRHRKNHLRVRVEGVIEPLDGQLDTNGMSDIEMLRQIILRGARFIPNWKVGPTEFFKAMDMYYKLTQGSAMAELFTALSAAAAAGPDVEEDGQDEALQETPS